MTPDMDQINRFLSSLPLFEDREAVLKMLQREALQEAHDVLNTGKRGDTLPQSAERVSDRTVI